MGIVVTKTLMVAYHALVEPALAIGLRRSRLRAFDPQPTLAAVALDVGKGPGCSRGCRVDRKAESRAVPRYLGRAGGETGHFIGRLLRKIDDGRRPTPMVVDLARYPTMADFEATLRRRSSRTLAKARRAAHDGYRVHGFPRARHALDIYAIKTSKPFRAGGPVVDYFLLRPQDVGPPAAEPDPSAPRCPRHWTRWWGVFRAARGHRQGDVTSDEELVAYVKLRRVGDLIHYVDIMGHADHLGRNVMILLHVEIMRWLIAREDHAAGVRMVLYGGLEHGGRGLLTWKKRAGFEPARLVRRDAPAA